MDWMYKNSSETVDREEYLLGRSIDKNFESQLSGSFNEVDKDITPASIFSNTGSNLQVDVIRKLKEDPLEQIRQKELETRKQLLKNPVKLKKLQNMLKAKQEMILKKKAKNKKKKSQEKMIDELLTSKFLQMKEKLGGKKLVDLTSEGRDSVRNRKHKKGSDLKRRKKKKKQKSESESSDTESSSSDSSSSTSSSTSTSSSEEETNPRKKHGREKSYVKGNSPKRELDNEGSKTFRKKYGLELKGRRDWGSIKSDKEKNSSSMSKPTEKVKTSAAPSRKRLTEEEKAERLKEMSANAEWRSHLTTKNFKRYKEEQKKEQETSEKDFDEGFFRRQMALATSQSSVQERIKSNVNKIQRSEKHMYENFARR